MTRRREPRVYDYSKANDGQRGRVCRASRSRRRSPRAPGAGRDNTRRDGYPSQTRIAACQQCHCAARGFAHFPLLARRQTSSGRCRGDSGAGVRQGTYIHGCKEREAPAIGDGEDGSPLRGCCCREAKIGQLRRPRAACLTSWYSVHTCRDDDSSLSIGETDRGSTKTPKPPVCLRGLGWSGEPVFVMLTVVPVLHGSWLGIRFSYVSLPATSIGAGRERHLVLFGLFLT